MNAMIGESGSGGRVHACSINEDRRYRSFQFTSGRDNAGLNQRPQGRESSNVVAMPLLTEVFDTSGLKLG